VDRPVADGAVIDLRFSPFPMGVNGEEATLWGADLRVVGIPQEAELVGEMADLFPVDDSEAPRSL